MNRFNEAEALKPRIPRRPLRLVTCRFSRFNEAEALKPRIPSWQTLCPA